MVYTLLPSILQSLNPIHQNFSAYPHKYKNIGDLIMIILITAVIIWESSLITISPCQYLLSFAFFGKKSRLWSKSPLLMVYQNTLLITTLQQDIQYEMIIVELMVTSNSLKDYWICSASLYFLLVGWGQLPSFTDSFIGLISWQPTTHTQFYSRDFHR